MSNRPANSNDQWPTFAGWLIAIVICAVLIGGVWLVIWLVVGRNAMSATGLTVPLILFLAFHAHWNDRTVHRDDGSLLLRPKPKYGFRWVVFWAACFGGCAGMVGMVCVTEDLSQSGPQLGVAILSAFGLLTLWLCLRRLWPRFTLHPPRVVLTEQSKRAVRGSFYQPCKRELERANVTVKVGYEKMRRFRVSDPDGDPGSTRKNSQLEFVVLAEQTHRAKFDSDGDTNQEIVVNFAFSMNDVPDHLAIETQTSFGGWWDYKTRL